MTKMPTYEELRQALTECLDDLNAWASSNPEGFTKDEAKRVQGYERILDRAAQAERAAMGKRST